MSTVVAMSNKAAATTKSLFGGPDKTHSFYTEDDVAFFFVFPEYGKAIPMRHGDILLFNPSVVHCASEPQFNDVHSFALYTSQKTVMHCDRDIKPAVKEE